MRALLLCLLAPLAAAGDGTVVLGEEGAALDADVQRASGGAFWGVVLVAKGGETLLAKGYGNADYASRPNAPDTLFEIASTSKSFTAAAILKLEMDGKLRVDDPIAKHLKGVPKDKRGITIHHVLTHTSGLSPNVGVPYASTVSRPEFIRFVLSKPLESAPGEKFAYCNSAYALLAAIVEEVTGKSFEEYSRKKLFEPAGLVDTGFIGDEALDGARVTVRRERLRPGATARDWFWGWGYRGMGGVVTTAQDLLRWDRALRGATRAAGRWPRRTGGPRRSSTRAASPATRSTTSATSRTTPS
jgi:CubicO group peptidase (beta-lactamase class C family)